MGEPELALVFVNYDSARWLRAALASAKQATGNLNVELLVVDNFSPGEKEREWLQKVGEEFGARVLLLKKNLGYGAAANRGVAHTRAEQVAVCNPDVQFTALSLRRLVEFIRSQPAAGVVSPQLYYPDGTPQPSCRRLPRVRYLFWGRRSPLVRMFPGHAPAREFLYLDAWRSTEPVEVEAVIGTVMVFRRSAFAAVGGFDEGYFMFAEDLDICDRLRRQGWRVFLEPRARVIHYYGAVRRRWRRRTEYHRVRGLRRYFIQRSGLPGSPLLSALFAGYYFGLEALAVAGLGEFEYSWQRRGAKTGGRIAPA